MLCGFNEKSEVSKYRTLFGSRCNIKLLNAKGKEKTTGYMATGDVYALYDSKGNIVDKLIGIVNGDVNGDDKVNAAITAGKAPDLIMEGPERLVANWGAKGYMVDLADMLDDTDKAEIQESVLNACTESGFPDYSSFLKTFRRLYGITPAEYRTQHRMQ